MRNLAWSFAPWFVFLITARVTSVELGIGAGLLAAALVCGRAIVDKRVHLLDVAGLVYFVSLAAVLVVSPVAIATWGQYAQLGSHVLLTLLVFGSIVVGHPFTEAYARETTPREFWATPEFHAINRRISAVWGLAFLVGTLSLWAATSIDSRPILLHVLVPFGALYVAFKYTTGQQHPDDHPSVAAA
ncbi:MAG: hypothetical protein JO057_08210 [Chloroflexi bacterium]|nr:hypothetical protein [Chloroflexota bacterium]